MVEKSGFSPCVWGAARASSNLAHPTKLRAEKQSESAGINRKREYSSNVEQNAVNVLAGGSSPSIPANGLLNADLRKKGNIAETD